MNLPEKAHPFVDVTQYIESLTVKEHALECGMMVFSHTAVVKLPSHLNFIPEENERLSEIQIRNRPWGYERRFIFEFNSPDRDPLNLLTKRLSS